MNKKKNARQQQLSHLNGSHRCNIVCPIEVVFSPQGYSTNQPLDASQHGTSPSQHPYAQQGVSPIFPHTSSPSITNIQTGDKPAGLIHKLTNQILGTVIPNILENNQRYPKGHHHLSEGQKKKLLKILHLANQHGKKIYRFRQLLQPYGCYVVCNEIQLLEGSATSTSSANPQQGSHNEDDDDSEDDDDEDGDEKPIVEATIEPAPPSKNHVKSTTSSTGSINTS